MKKIISILNILIFAIGFSQTNNQYLLQNKDNSTMNSLPKIFITKDVNILFRSPEPVQFVDLSNENLIGDLPAENIVRLKIAKFLQNDNPLDTLSLEKKKEINYQNGQDLGVISVVGQSFMAQYKLIYTTDNLLLGGDSDADSKIVTNIQITQKDMLPIQYPSNELSEFEIKKYSQKILKYGDVKKVRSSKDYKMGIEVNNIYAYDQYIFLDLTFRNTTNLPYDIGNVEFSVDDKKIYKSTNNQSISIKPIFEINKNKRFRSQFRNIYVFKKFTFPNDKVLNIRIYEKGISGRTLSLQVKYSDLLEADTL